MPHEVHTYAELKQQIHDDLRTQHPEWMQPGGKCPECDEHEARLKELLEALVQDKSRTEARQQLLAEDQTPGTA
jgi:hypothetical protein